MSKRPEENDIPDMEAGMTTAERRRRRRRGAGLRVPSDNVPRRSGNHAAVGPVSDDASLGVSIAYSFSPESGPHRSELHEAASAAAASMGGAQAPTFGEDDEATVAGTRGDLGVPEDDGDYAEAWVEEGGEVGSGPHDDADGGFDTKTREMPALRLPVPGGRAATASGEIQADAGAPASRDSVPGRRAGTVALSEDDLEELVDVDAASSARMRPQRRALTAPPVPPPERAATAPGEIRRPRTDEGMPGLQRPAPDAVVAAPAAATASEGIAVVELDDDDLEGEVVQPGDAADSGEILADELLEEVEAQAAQAVPLTAPDPRFADAAVPEAVAPEPPARAITQPPRDVTPPPAAAPAVQAAPASTAPLAPTASPAPIDRPSIPSLATSSAVLAGAPGSSQAPAAAPAPPPPPAGATVTSAKPPPAPKKASAARAAAVAAAAANEPQGRKKKRGKPWFEEIFDEDYLRTLPFLTPQATQGEAQFVIDTLGLSPGAQVLDLGCGYGRHAMELAARGYHVVGLDLSLPLLLRGADEAQRRGLSINFVHGDMRELDFDSQFDGAYCLFSTFGYFDDEANKKTAANLARALKPGARAVIEVLNRDYLITDLPTRVWWEGDGCVVLEEVDFNYFSSRITSNRSVVFDDGRQLDQEISIRAYALHELGKLLHAAGFRVLEVSGSMVTRGRFFGNQSRQIIAVAERRPKDDTSTTKI